jgi:hypothetical protein
MLKALGHENIAVCEIDGSKADAARQMGALEVFNPLEEGVLQKLQALSGGIWGVVDLVGATSQAPLARKLSSSGLRELEAAQEAQAAREAGRRDAAPLAAVDHEAAEYEAFDRDFYTPAPEVARLSAAVVAARCAALGVRLGGRDPPAPVERFGQCGLPAAASGQPRSELRPSNKGAPPKSETPRAGSPLGAQECFNDGRAQAATFLAAAASFTFLAKAARLSARLRR